MIFVLHNYYALLTLGKVRKRKRCTAKGLLIHLFHCVSRSFVPHRALSMHHFSARVSLQS